MEELPLPAVDQQSPEHLISTHPFPLCPSSYVILSSNPIIIPLTIPDTKSYRRNDLNEAIWLYTNPSLPGSIGFLELARRMESFQRKEISIMGDATKDEGQKRMEVRDALEKARRRIYDRRMRYQWRVERERGRQRQGMELQAAAAEERRKAVENQMARGRSSTQAAGGYTSRKPRFDDETAPPPGTTRGSSRW
ncbi:hypothetical protein BDZ91DRAFT_766787 [Kalaharituber pfeilii]|nr:hypothetical protein BDZ91DRAFT_766787 [Kalaharituber pfeilii]